MPSGEIATRLRVRYAETDAMGIVHHSQYAIWFEAGRSDFFRAAGLPYSACESQGAYFPVTEEFVRFSQSAVYDEEITICTRVAEAEQRHGIASDHGPIPSRIKALRQVIRLRKIERAEREEQEMILETYLIALGEA